MTEVAMRVYSIRFNGEERLERLLRSLEAKGYRIYKRRGSINASRFLDGSGRRVHIIIKGKKMTYKVNVHLDIITPVLHGTVEGDRQLEIAKKDIEKILEAQ